MKKRKKYYFEGLVKDIGHFLFHAQMLGKQLREIVLCSEEKIRKLLIRSNYKIIYNPALLKNENLFQLISKFNVYCSSDKLIQNLKDFNSRRNIIIHRLLVKENSSDLVSKKELKKIDAQCLKLSHCLEFFKIHYLSQKNERMKRILIEGKFNAKEYF